MLTLEVVFIDTKDISIVRESEEPFEVNVINENV